MFLVREKNIKTDPNSNFFGYINGGNIFFSLPVFPVKKQVFGNKDLNGFLALLFCFFGWQTAVSQQVENFSLLRENAYILNPALCGSKGFLNVTGTFRKQFMNIARSPYTIFLGAEGQLADKNVGLGGYIINDQTGPTGLTGVGVSAAYQIRFNKHRLLSEDQVHYNTAQRHMLTVGIGISMMQYRLNGNQLNPENPNDPDLDKIRRVQWFPDATLGIYYQHKERFYMGFSVPQLLGLNLKYSLANGTSEIRKVQHFNFLVGGKIDLEKRREVRFTIEPVAALRVAKNAPIQGDLGLRLTAYKTVWIGVLYRSVSQLVAEGGIAILDYGRICYAADFQVGKLSGQVGISHEISLIFTMKKPAQKGFINQ